MAKSVVAAVIHVIPLIEYAKVFVPKPAATVNVSGVVVLILVTTLLVTIGVTYLLAAKDQQLDDTIVFALGIMLHVMPSVDDII